MVKKRLSRILKVEQLRGMTRVSVLLLTGWSLEQLRRINGETVEMRNFFFLKHFVYLFKREMPSERRNTAGGEGDRLPKEQGA